MSADEFNAEKRAFQKLVKAHTLTCWHVSEVRHPIFFFEQRVRCTHCGAERFRTTNALACCRGGKLLLEARLPDALLSLMTGKRTPEAAVSAQALAQGISKCSRALNNKFRFAQMRLPKVRGERQAPAGDSFQHLRITGIPYAQTENLNVVSSTRSFLDDPSERFGTWAKQAGPRRGDVVREYGDDDDSMHEDDEPTSRYFAASSAKWAPRPHATDVRLFESIMHRESPIVDSLVNHARDARDAFLVLRYEGTTTSVRAFTTIDSAAVTQPREVAFSRLQDGSKVNIRSTHPMYSALMWPLFFPHAQPLPFRKDGRVQLWDVRASKEERSEAAMGALAGLAEDAHGGRTECWSIAQMALALLSQPEKRGNGEVVRHPTISPYADEPPILRPFSKLELCGRLGDEVLLDMFLAAEDARLFYLGLPAVQQRLTGRFQSGAEVAETADDAEALARGSYLPPSVQGGPRHLRDCIANALTAVNDAPCEADVEAGHGPHSDPLLFGTMAMMVKEWEEIQTELPVFGGVKQDVFDRAGLTSEAFHGKLAALLARLRTGTAFPNVGRPVASARAKALRSAPRPPNESQASHSAAEEEPVDGLRAPPHANEARFRGSRGKASLKAEQDTWTAEFRTWCAEWKDETRRWRDGEERPEAQAASEDDSEDESGGSDDGNDASGSEDEGAAPASKRQRNAPFDRARKAYYSLLHEYVFPMSIDGGGYIIYSIEYQGRGLVHVHFVWRPAKLSNVEGYERKTTPGEEVAWADQFVCAKIPTYEVLKQFKMLLPRDDILALEGICDPGLTTPRAAYAYLNDNCNATRVEGKECYVHPEIAHDFGLVKPCDLLADMLKLTVGEQAKGNPLRHWSQEPGHSNVKSLEGNMIHYHVSGGERPNKWCAKHGNADECDEHFPMPTTPRTIIGDDRRVLYKRDEHEVWVVPYNPWLLLYYRAHINVQVVSTSNVIYYLFKYILKGLDKNKAQVVVDGGAPRGSQAGSSTRTHNRREPRDEIGIWRELREVCANNAYWRHCEYTSYGQEPPCEKVSMHIERQRAGTDEGFSQLEKYFWRPLALTRTDRDALPKAPRELLFTEFTKFFDVHPLSSTPAHRDPTAGEARDCASAIGSELIGVTRDGRGVYRVELSDARPSADGQPYTREYFYCRRKARRRRHVRLTRVPHSAGAVHFARMLITRRAATSFVDLRTTPDENGNSTVHDTFEDACRALGLLKGNAMARELLQESVCFDSPYTARSLCAQLMLDEGVAMLELLRSTEHVPNASCGSSLWDFMASDFKRGHTTPEAVVKNACLSDLEARLNAHGRSMKELGYPEDWLPQGTASELERHKLLHDRADERARADCIPLDTKPGAPEQTRVLNWSQTGDPNGLAPRTRPDETEVGFLHGDGGTGKSYLIARVVAETGANGGVALVTAATNLAATNFNDASTLHNLLGLGCDERADDGSVSVKTKREGGKMSDDRLALLRAAWVIIVDEAPSLHKSLIEAFVHFLRSHGCHCRVLLAGDFKQIPPVVKNGGRDLVYEASLCSSWVYRDAVKMALTKQYRAADDEEWAADVQNFGHGRTQRVGGHSGNDAERGRAMVRMPLVESLFHEDDAGYERAALEWLYGCNACGELNVTGECSVRGCACRWPGQGARGCCRKAILCTTNEVRDKWNEKVSAARAAATGTTAERSYSAFHDKKVDANVEVAAELLASALGEDDLETLYHDASVPPANLSFRVGDEVLLMQTMDKTVGLVNNVRLRVVELRPNSLKCALEHQHGVTTHHIIYRRPFTIRVGRSGIAVVRRQIPLVRAYALTINKSQGQTLDRVLFDARRHPHQHGHAYVLFSRVRTRRDLAAVVDTKTSERQRGGGRAGHVLVTANVLYDELISGERAARRAAATAGGVAASSAPRQCAGCCELMLMPRVGTLICEPCEEKLDGGAGERNPSSDEDSDHQESEDVRGDGELSGGGDMSDDGAESPRLIALRNEEEDARQECSRLYLLERKGTGPSDLAAQLAAAKARSIAAQLAVLRELDS